MDIDGNTRLGMAILISLPFYIIEIDLNYNTLAYMIHILHQGLKQLRNKIHQSQVLLSVTATMIIIISYYSDFPAA